MNTSGAPIYLRTAEQDCLGPVSGAVPNCLYHSGAATCARCILADASQNHYYLKDNACVVLPVEVPHCVSYDAIGKCRACRTFDLQNTSQAYYLDFVAQKCLPVTNFTEPNCLLFEKNGTGDVQCARCRQKDPGSGETLILNSSGRCQPQYFEDGTCTQFDTSGICTECQTPSYPSGGRCVLLDPGEVLDYCLRYDSSKHCTLCDYDMGQYLSTATHNCQSMGIVANCIRYQDNFCVECKAISNSN